MVAIDKRMVDHQTRTRLPGDLVQSAHFPSNPDLVVVIPAYNEARFIGSVVLQALQFTSQVIVVDDGSADDTAQIARCAGASVVSHESNLGKGAALNTGFRDARQCDPQVVVCLDGDGQHLPEDIDPIIEPILSQQADIVVGSRYIGTTNHVPRSRVWGHQFFNLLTRYASGLASSDSQSGFRAFSPHALQALSFCSKDFTVESEMQFLAREHALIVVDVPVTIRYMDPPKRSVLVHGMRVLNGVLRLVGQHRPLLYFGVTGTAVLIVGIVLGFRVVETFSRTKQLAVGTALITILLSMIGMIMISTGFTIHSIRALLNDMMRQNRRKNA